MSHSPDHNVKNHDEIEPATEEIMALLSQLATRFGAEDDEEWQWMAQNCPNPLIVEMLPELTVMMLHVLDAIGRLEPVNGITISKQFQIPKGSVSKITRRLIAKKLIKKEFLPNNKKEVLFRMTPLGQELFEVHRALHEKMNKGFIQFLQRYKVEELHFIVRVLQELMEMPRVNMEFRPDLLDKKLDG